MKAIKNQFTRNERSATFTRAKDSSYAVAVNSPRHAAMASVHIGVLTGIDADGKALVNYKESVYTAESLEAYDAGRIGERCALAFEDGDFTRPLIVGFLWTPSQTEKQTVISASEALTLECGESSLELEANGTIRLKGVTVTTQAYGSNRIKGAAVKIN
ncbi:MAG: DUF6484 domain-containing protein [Gammaproteobacteria bacterium]